MSVLSWMLRLYGKGVVKHGEDIDSCNYDPWVLLAMQCFEREIDEEQKKDLQSQTQMELAASYAMLIAPAARNRAMR
jgi:hypothetical protein